MRMFHLITGAAALALSVPAAAQEDAPFTGGHVGVSLGYDLVHKRDNSSIEFDRNLDGRFGDTITTAAGANAFSPGFCDGFARTSAPAGGCRKDKDSVSYSLRAGYDWQSGSLVYGALAEIGKSEIRDSVSAFSTTPANYVLTRKIDYLASIRGRLGFAANRTLFYATGGAVYGKVDNRNNTTNTANSFTLRGDDSAWGAQFGGGVEHKLGDNFSVGVEYLYTQLNDDGFRVRVGNSGTTPATNPFLLGNTAGTDFRRSDDRFRFSSIRATASYRF